MVLVGAGVGSLAIASAMIMGGSPEDKAGNAGALEEASYELGAVLGITVLGSVSTLVFRDHLRDLTTGLGLPGEVVDPAGGVPRRGNAHRRGGTVAGTGNQCCGGVH
ncbi:hypothetical protein [Corynebacterium glyciniphilum]|uniref:hypothetical protein n=1 Tax=Corynebacterium glyciniphilum TaxID=1404244 RepID=UPI002652BCC1|nr:hypothetical protein [Corynebacterium glyciniphilum]MDN5683553.1 hypothetical protein [Corynebacterium glyciniphilum]MDN6706840.1 hypothetical protein [Corynebacterium glyciniphilum]